MHGTIARGAQLLLSSDLTFRKKHSLLVRILHRISFLRYTHCCLQVLIHLEENMWIAVNFGTTLAIPRWFVTRLVVQAMSERCKLATKFVFINLDESVPSVLGRVHWCQYKLTALLGAQSLPNLLCTSRGKRPLSKCREVPEIETQISNAYLLILSVAWNPSLGLLLKICHGSSHVGSCIGQVEYLHLCVEEKSTFCACLRFHCCRQCSWHVSS